MPWGHHGGHGFWVALWWLLGGIGVVVFVWLLIRRCRPGASGPDSMSSEEILERRYAKGEIDREEYERRLADLRR